MSAANDAAPYLAITAYLYSHPIHYALNFDIDLYHASTEST